ncbi:MAG: phosphoribosylanthranilate isomerase [Oscillospiraceae bacterium]|jgi:phosphoribosylanthranilate isomerase|nr:phosphoribosylanthranilate isomerase [Oscillospiraceae bacterium]
MQTCKIKICGLTRIEDIDYVNLAKPDYIGFVFAESKRRIEPEFAARLRELLNPGIVPVGVFVNAEIQSIVNLYKSGVIGIAQLHGGERGSYIERLKSYGIPIIQAIRHGRNDIPSELADYHLFDSPNGGSGEVFDRGAIPLTGKPFFLAGGINAANIADALKLAPYAIDVSSGAETNGVKDCEKIQAIVTACRNFV